MNTDYNFRRIALLLRADWIENKKGYLFGMGVLFLVWMLFLLNLFIAGRQMNRSGDAMQFIGMIVSFILFCKHAARKMHRPKGIYLLLPASNAEKYTALLLEALAYLVGFQVVFLFGFLLWKPFIPGLVITPLLQGLTGHGDGGASVYAPLSVILFVSSLIFLSYMSFRKHAQLIALGGIGLYSLFAFAAWNFVMEITSPWEFLDSSYMYNTVTFLLTYCAPVMYASTVVVMYVAYLKLKEKEER
ncbi:MAG: hypothetical protein LBI58_06080 [Tannerellaceae bacterium]|jgi:hypothetical protein|nr:hypothetical protein [Tannerellaceae bacterium]